MTTTSSSLIVGVHAHHAWFLHPDVSRLQISLNLTVIREFQTRDLNSQTINIPLFYPTHVLLQPLLCRFHVQNSLSGLDLPLRVYDQLVQGISSSAQNLITHVEAPVNRRHHRFNGFLFTADIMITNTVAMPYHSLGYQVTEITTTSNMAQIDFNDDDHQLMVLDEVTSAERAPPPSPSPTRSIAGRLRSIDKLMTTEHELVNAGNDNIRDQLGDGECCSICLEEFLCDGINKSKNMLVRFRCTHLYHQTCILQWLDQKDSCPLCRRQL